MAKKKEESRNSVFKSKKKVKSSLSRIKTLDLRSEKDIAMDFAVKIYKRFDKMVKAVVLFGSTTKKTANESSDIDLIVIIDDAAIQWDQELIAWYREELSKLVSTNPYKKELHITTTKITTWWNDLIKGDPVILNVLRYGEALVDIGGFFNPIKALLIQGRIRKTPEAIYNALDRAPEHFRRSKLAELGAIEGLFWAMVDSSQAALMSANIMPPSPEQIPALLKEIFVDKKMLKMDYAVWFRDLYVLHKDITHGKITDLKGVQIDNWQERTEKFIGEMVRIVNESIS
ncbi:MAG: nucleotidyltransferase domain-containing protein [Candidatus Pacearchaeota archaeon]